jgi:tetratricopeptide (TPR) repeat protein
MSLSAMPERIGRSRDVRSKVTCDYRLAGDAYYNAYQFQDALNAYQKALAEVDKETDPQQWASLMIDISNTYQNLGIRIGGESGQMQLANAVAGYRAIFNVYTRDTLPQDWATTQNNLGNALSEQGTRTGGEAGAALLAEAVGAFRAALTVRTRDTLPQQWAGTQNNLGIALKEQALRANDEQTQQRLLHEAIDALHNASEVYTYKDIPARWAIVQRNLAETYFKIGDSFNRLQYLIPPLFVTERFADVEKVLTKILPNVESVPQLDIPLRAIEIAMLLAQRKPEEIPAKLQTLIATLQEQPEDFRLDWNFNEMKQFISTSDLLLPYREWLLAFFNTLEAEHRDAILQGLHAVQKEFEEMALH